MNPRLILSVGMPRAGSGWHYNLIHDLMVASGGSDSRRIRHRYHLGRVLTEVNCNIGSLAAYRLLPVLAPVLMGHTYVIKAHAAPKPLARFFIRRGWIRATYIYRDPRDALLSAYEYGQRGLQQGRANAFSPLDTIEKAIDFMQTYVHISEAWLACESVLGVSYENLLTNYAVEAARLIAFLGLNETAPAVAAVIAQYHPAREAADQRGLHFVKGRIGRHRQKLTAEQLALCQHAFGAYLQQREYF